MITKSATFHAIGDLFRAAAQEQQQAEQQMASAKQAGLTISFKPRNASGATWKPGTTNQVMVSVKNNLKSAVKDVKISSLSIQLRQGEKVLAKGDNQEYEGNGLRFQLTKEEFGEIAPSGETTAEHLLSVTFVSGAPREGLTFELAVGAVTYTVDKADEAASASDQFSTVTS